MKTKILSINILLIIIVIGIFFTACKDTARVYLLKRDVPDLQNDSLKKLGQAALWKEIARYQRNEVWSGGTEYWGCYMDDDRKEFLQSHGLDKIRIRALKNEIFMREIIGLKTLTKNQQEYILAELEQPIDSTWEETGKVGHGTTIAGQETESDIAHELVDVIEELLYKTDKDIEQLWIENHVWTKRLWWKIFGNPQLIKK